MTVNLYSDHESIALHEAGHAKDFASRDYKGFYAAVRMLPLVALFQEGVATGDAIGYDRAKAQTEDQKADYKILYPAYGTYVGGEALRWVNVNMTVDWAVRATGALVGHVVGRIKAASVEELPEEERTIVRETLPVH